MARANNMTLTATSTRSEFAEFYTANFARIASQIYAYLGDHAEAQDLTQEAFCRAYDRWVRVVVLADPAGWVRRVAWNLATSRLRHLQVARRFLSRQRVEEVDGPSPDRIAIVEALSKLPPKHRLAVVLHYFADLSAAEIAQQRDVPESTVRSWLMRGRNQLAEQLIGSPDELTVKITPPGVSSVQERVHHRRVVRRSAVAAALAIALAIPTVILLRVKGNEPPIIGPTTPPSSPSPSPSPSSSPRPAPQAVAACTGKPLPLPPGMYGSLFSGGDPSGRYLLGTVSAAREANERPVVWIDGKVTVIPPIGKHIGGMAANAQGVVAGSTHTDGSSGFKVWLFRDGRLEVVFATEDPNQARHVYGINAKGDVLVRAKDRGLMIYSGGDFQQLPPAPIQGEIWWQRLEDDGTVIGFTNGQAVIWTPQGETKVVDPPPARDVRIVDVRGEWAVGQAKYDRSARPGTKEKRGVLRWNLRTGEQTEFTDLYSVSRVTPDGWMLASVQVAEKTGDNGYSYHYPPVLVMGTQRLAMPAISGVPAKDDSSGGFMSDDGRVIGGESKAYGTGRNYATVWTCH